MNGIYEQKGDKQLDNQSNKWHMMLYVTVGLKGQQTNKQKQPTEWSNQASKQTTLFVCI
jgi:hypothetical protein